MCPNFSANGTFAGAVAAVNAFRILNEEQESTHLNEISAEYKKKYFEGCGKSLSCHDICPIGLPVEELLVRSNAAAVWANKMDDKSYNECMKRIKNLILFFLKYIH